MLLPALEFADAPPVPEPAPQSPKRKNSDTPATADAPISKRLRVLGRSLFDSAYEIAPEWARTFVDGPKLADATGQHHGPVHNDQLAPTASEINAAMGVGARKLGKIAVIGIHGWFPTKMLQMVAGEPTGKSEKFCVMMREALHTYLTENHSVDVSDSDISLFPLVGEGRIEDRVDLLLSQIIDPGPVPAEIREALEGPDDSRATKKKAKRVEIDPSLVAAEMLMPERSQRADVLGAADTVFVVTHSQGTPVSALLLERLMELGLVAPRRQRVCMLAMAGISHGPMPYLRDNVVIRYIESEAARELFELMDPSSPQSQRYVAALSTILHKGVRLICVGSWVDEVVPLYSGILQGVSHPNVYRAVYIDAPHYLDDFLSNLIVFALRLRNMGIYDHDLLIHLSEVVAGSLWGHSGHSTVYGEPDVYKLSVKWLLYSTSAVSQSAIQNGGAAVSRASGEQIHMNYRPFNAAEKLNPFYIPWIMRTLWDEPEIRQNSVLRAELRRLIMLYDKWKPETKAGKELKYRLEPVRAAI